VVTSSVNVSSNIIIWHSEYANLLVGNLCQIICEALRWNYANYKSYLGFTVVVVLDWYCWTLGQSVACGYVYLNMVWQWRNFFNFIDASCSGPNWPPRRKAIKCSLVQSRKCKLFAALNSQIVEMALALSFS